jgi:peroxiredoxin
MKRLLLTLLLAAVPATSFAQSSDSLRVGDTAPDFSLPYATRDSIASAPLTLSSLLGKGPVVLAFYPADWSGGCTKEVCTLRDNFADLSALKADVVGISGDYVFTHNEWAKHHDLPFRLASDHKHVVAQRYSSYNEEAGFNKRTVYAIDKGGKITYIDLHYSPRDSTSFLKLRDALRHPAKT